MHVQDYGIAFSVDPEKPLARSLRIVDSMVHCDRTKLELPPPQDPVLPPTSYSPPQDPINPPAPASPLDARAEEAAKSDGLDMEFVASGLFMLLFCCCRLLHHNLVL